MITRPVLSREKSTQPRVDPTDSPQRRMTDRRWGLTLPLAGLPLRDHARQAGRGSRLHRRLER